MEGIVKNQMLAQPAFNDLAPAAAPSPATKCDTFLLFSWVRYPLKSPHHHAIPHLPFFFLPSLCCPNSEVTFTPHAQKFSPLRSVARCDLVSFLGPDTSRHSSAAKPKQGCWYMSKITAFEEWRQENWEFEDISLSYMRPCLNPFPKIVHGPIVN